MMGSENSVGLFYHEKFAFMIDVFVILKISEAIKTNK